MRDEGMTELVERAARALAKANNGGTVDPWDKRNASAQARYRNQARTAIAEVFDYLAEPSQGAIAAGLDQYASDRGISIS